MDVTALGRVSNRLGRTEYGARAYRFFESVPGLITWGIITGAILLGLTQPLAFVTTLGVFSSYWIVSCIEILVRAFRGYRRIRQVEQTDWIALLERDHPDWHDYYYCALLPFASESIEVLRPTVQSIASTSFPKERRILCLSSEKALPAGQEAARALAREFEGDFAHVFVTEHVLRPGEVKGKASNENHGGRFLYDRILELGIDPGKVLLTSNDADVQNDPRYPAYLLYTYLSQGGERDFRIYQPVPSDYSNYWEAAFFSRVIVTTGLLWRIALQASASHRCTVYSFYSLSLKTLRAIDFWDPDVIPEDERTMFKAIATFGESFRVEPLFIMMRGAPVSGGTMFHSIREQYVQIRRWAWGASEIAHSLSQYLGASKSVRRALLRPILNQIRTATEWSLAPIFLMFGGAIPELLRPDFAHTKIGHLFPTALSILMTLPTLLLVAVVALNARIAPPPPPERGRLFVLGAYAQWLAAPVVGLLLSAIPALEAQTRLIINRRIAYVESRKELWSGGPKKTPRKKRREPRNGVPALVVDEAAS